MPKLVNRPPKYGKMGKYAFVTHNRKRIYLGLYGSPESHEAYARFVAERRLSPDLVLPKGESNVAVKELAAAFLDYANMREVLNAIFYLLVNGCGCRNLPHDFPPEGTVRDYFHQWHPSGCYILASY